MPRVCGDPARHEGAGFIPRLVAMAAPKLQGSRSNGMPCLTPKRASGCGSARFEDRSKATQAKVASRNQLAAIAVKSMAIYKAKCMPNWFQTSCLDSGSAIAAGLERGSQFHARSWRAQGCFQISEFQSLTPERQVASTYGTEKLCEEKRSPASMVGGGELANSSAKCPIYEHWWAKELATGGPKRLRDCIGHRGPNSSAQEQRRCWRGFADRLSVGARSRASGGFFPGVPWSVVKMT